MYIVIISTKYIVVADVHLILFRSCVYNNLIALFKYVLSSEIPTLLTGEGGSKTALLGCAVHGDNLEIICTLSHLKG